MVKVGVCLSGCGVYDGAEIHESVITLLELAKAGVEAVCFAPDVPQMHVVDHMTGEVSAGQTRNVLQESARIARGKVLAASKVNGADFDALIFPGGFGAAKNLSTFATQGADCSVDPDVSRILQEARAASRPIGLLCIAPALGAAVLGRNGETVELTIGTDAGTAGALTAMGAQHVERAVDEIHVDLASKVVSTPCYMLAQNIAEAATGVEALVAKVLELIAQEK